MSSLATDELEHGSLISENEQMKNIRKKIDVNDPLFVNYPRTKKGREKSLLASKNCSEDFFYDTADEKVRFINCYLKNLNYIPSSDNAIKTINSLNKKSGNATVKDVLPIYLINGHSSVEPRIILKPPKNMNNKLVEEVQTWNFVDQLKEGFSLNVAPSTKNVNHPSRNDFLKTKPESNIFFVTTMPVGYDASCGDDNQNEFLKNASKNKFKTLRKGLLSERFRDFFTPHTNWMIYDEFHSKFFQNILFFPPGYSVLNKVYQFYDHSKKSMTRDKWGVIRLDTLTPNQIKDGALNFWDPPIKATFSGRLKAIHPQCDSKIKDVIQKSVVDKTHIPLKEIIKKLGAGIYLDFGCSGLVMSIYDSERKNYKSINPDDSHNIDYYLPFYVAVQEGLETMSHYSKLAWNNIVSIKEPTKLVKKRKADLNILIDSSRQFKKLTTDLQKASEKSMRNYGGGKRKQKRKTRRKRGGRRKKTRRRKKGGMKKPDLKKNERGYGKSRFG